MQNSKQLNLFIMGFGNAAKAFCILLDEKNEEILKETGYEIKVVSIFGHSKGSLNVPEGIDLKDFNSIIKGNENLESNLNRKLNFEEIFRSDQLLDSSIDPIEFINLSNANVLIELSPLSVFDGQPAISYIEAAFAKGMHVVTANKGPIACDFKRLNKLANDSNVEFLYETTVMDGTPIFNLLKYSLPGCKVLSFKGILNSTTNFILSQMEQDVTYDNAVIEAQRRGFAEADPSMDVLGWDSAGKTAAIANVLMNGNLNPRDIKRIGIDEISRKEIDYAKENNKRIKLICEAYYERGKLVGKVAPAMIDKSDIYSMITETSSIISINTDLMGEISILENAPEIQQTAYGIYSDLYTLLRILS
jgi:homoserine dehydrogenase